MKPRHTPASLLTSTEPILHCCETWHVLAAGGRVLPNRPKQQETWDALAALRAELLLPLAEWYGVVSLTYGFSGPELVKAIRQRAREGGWLPNIHPPSDQHAGYELNRNGKRICKRDGIAVDLRIPDHSSEDVVWRVVEALPFDRIYLYGPDKAFHLSWAPAEQRVGQVVRMVPTDGGRLVPRMIVRGR